MVLVPIKPFVYFDFKDWQLSLLARPGIEDVMDDAWKSMDDPSSDPHRGGVMRDIFHGDVLRNLPGPGKGGDIKFFKDGGEEGRYAYSLCIDFFNPYTNKLAGKKRSVGIISLVCLNLPPDIRYKPENMYLAGVVPGPREPQLDAINHYLRPLIDDFCDSWEHGFNFSCTHKFPKGRRVVCAIVALVCDLPGACKASCFAAFSHTHFCSVCHCTRDKEGYGCTNHHQWKRRTNEECREFAGAFKEAETEKDAQAHFDSTGVRWSELLRLPYFDPARFVVVDAMHNLFLGLIKEHIVNILGVKVNRGDPPEPVVFKINLSGGWRSLKENEQKDVHKIHRWLQGPLVQDLTDSRSKIERRFERCRKSALQFIWCEVTGEPFLQPPTRKVTVKVWVQKLLDWRVEQTEISDVAASTSTMTGHVVAPEEIKEIWNDIQNMVKPSWLTSAPPDLGSLSHGKLKADEWRAIRTTYLPVSLIRLWSQSEDTDPRSQRCKDILNVTMLLVSAILIASSQETSRAHAELYLQHMVAYIEGIKKLFPNYKIHPNHHMAMHLPDYLIRYGPIHAWWTFPFERVIGMLQQTSTNCKIGELEETMACAYTRSANLRNFVSRTGCPEAIRRCYSIFNKLVNPCKHGSLYSDLIASVCVDDVDYDNDIDIDYGSNPAYDDKATVEIPSDLKQALKESFKISSTKAQLLPRIYVDGLPYTVSSTHMGNSCILAQTVGTEKLIPLRITEIFRVKVGRKIQTFIAACTHLPYEGNIEDPFSAYPILKAQLWSPKLGHLQVFPVENLKSHFAMCPLTWGNAEAVVIVSLARVVLLM